LGFFDTISNGFVDTTSLYAQMLPSLSFAEHMLESFLLYGLLNMLQVSFYTIVVL